MPFIRTDAGIVTQINTFTVPEARQQQLIELLQEAARFASTTPAGARPACIAATTAPGW
ncbi:hypothetical protein ACQ856_06855 [Mycolicibacterium psychrotolerans]|uniref:hypothetical protein n=1 Tax=Mycolicibacterium psychrotolerans TaxID=216929 RepID=UPI003D665434